MVSIRRLYISILTAAARFLPSGLKRIIYRFEPLAMLIRKALNRSLPIGLSEVTLSAGRFSGMRMLLDLQTEKDYWLGTYELELQEAIESWVKPKMVVYDVGANIGYLTLLFGRYVGADGHVFAFEALPENLTRLKVNLSLNHLENHVTVVPKAVIDRSAPVEFLRGPSNATGKVAGSVGRNDLQYGEKFAVEGLGLDDFVYQQQNLPPQVIKIDIEGGEVLALKGMPRILEECRPILFVELHGPVAADALWDLQAKVRYQLLRMESGYPKILSRRSINWKEYLIALPD